MADSKMKSRWIIVIGAILIQLCLGAIYAWSAFTTHLQSSEENLIFNYDAELLGLDKAAVEAERIRIFGNLDISKEGWDLIKKELILDVKSDLEKVGSNLDIDIYKKNKAFFTENYGITNFFRDKCDAIVAKLKKHTALIETKPVEFDLKLMEAKRLLSAHVYNFIRSSNVIEVNGFQIIDKGGKNSQDAINKVVFIPNTFDKDGILDKNLIGKNGEFTDDAVRDYILPDVKDYEGFWRAVEKLKITFKKTPPVRRDLFNQVSKEKWEKYHFGFTATETQWIFAAGLASFALIMILAGRWQDKSGPRLVAMIGGAVLGLGYLLAGLVGGANQILMLIFVGIIGGAGIGLGYVCPIAAGTKWFPDKKGLISGLAVFGFGAGAYIFIKLAGAWGGLINSMGINNTFTIYGIIFAVVVILGALLIKNPPEGWKPKGWNPKKAGAKKSMSTYDFSPRQMLGTRQFYFIWVTFILSAGAGLMVIGTLKDFGYFEGGVPMAAAASALATLAIFNGLGRIVWGWLSDRIGRKFAINLMILLQGLMMIGVLFIGKSSSGLMFAACWIGFNFGGNFALFPAATADYFGLKNLGSNYGWVFTAYGVGGIFGPIMAGSMYDMTGSYTYAFITIAILLAVALLISLMFRVPTAPVVAKSEK
ncbi:MAG: MFS transporter [Planctomycetes bacterium]|nr:MFS transporter [Planctomycetota bacterium]